MAYKLVSGEQWLRDETTNELVGIKDSVDGEERLVVFSSVNPVTGVITNSAGGTFLSEARPAWKRTGLWGKRSVAIDNMSGANANWSVFSGTGTKADSTEVVLSQADNTNALKLNITNNFYRIRRAITSTNLSGVINTWIYISEDPRTNQNITVRFWDGTYTNSMASTYTTAHGLRKGWNCISWHATEDGTTTSSGAAPANSGSSTFPNTITGIQLEFGNFEQAAQNTGVVPSVYVGGIYHQGEGKAAVLLNWDDSTSDQYAIFKLFRRYSIKGAISIIPTNIDAGGLTLAQLQEMYAEGWDVVNHTMHSTAGNLAADSYATVYSKISEARDWMLSHGFLRTANVLVWPENNYTSTVSGVDMIAIAQSLGMVITRGSQRRDMATAQGLDNPMRLASADFGGKTLAQALKLLDSAEKYKQLNIIYGHKIVGTDTSPASGGAAPVDTLTWNRSDYIAFAENLCDRITAGTIQVVTYSDLLDKFRV